MDAHLPTHDTHTTTNTHDGAICRDTHDRYDTREGANAAFVDRKTRLLVIIQRDHELRLLGARMKLVTQGHNVE